MCNDLKASDWIAIFAGVIALLALIVTLRQLILAKRHNLLSTRPVLDVDCHSREDEFIGIKIRNCGPGPAFLSSVKLTFRNTRYNMFKRDNVQSLINTFAENGLLASKYGIAVPTETSVISPGETYELFLVRDTAKRAELARKFEELMHTAKIEIEYRSLYEKKYATAYEDPVLERT